MTKACHRYYEGGISSAYCWDVDDGFAAVILVKKSMPPSYNLFFIAHISLQHKINLRRGNQCEELGIRFTWWR